MLGVANRSEHPKQVFDRRGTFIGTVGDARDAKVVEIDLDRQASVEIFGEEVESLAVDRNRLYVLDVLRLDRTIEELRREEAA